MASISQNETSISLPDFRNLGTILRSIIAVNIISLMLVVARANQPDLLRNEFFSIVAFIEPTLLLSILGIGLFQPLIRKVSHRIGGLFITFITLSISTVVFKTGEFMLNNEITFSLIHVWCLTILVTGMMLFYFNLRERALSPALSEARLQALQARIRPHFLFNSLNAVLSLIRSEPKRAERVLLNMAELFRVLMADNNQLTTIEKEIELCRQYLEIEQLRLGDRLKVVWHIEKMPDDALIPPLLLQPLLENAVYHGVEPANNNGEICINIYRNRDQVIIVLRNPYHPDNSHHGGNKMAMGNIKERLALHFDAEASFTTKFMGDTYQVTITIPYLIGKK